MVACQGLRRGGRNLGHPADLAAKGNPSWRQRRLPGQMVSKNYWYSFRPSVAVLFTASGRLPKTFQEM